jgi:hypothetical protein
MLSSCFASKKYLSRFLRNSVSEVHIKFLGEIHFGPYHSNITVAPTVSNETRYRLNNQGLIPHRGSHPASYTTANMALLPVIRWPDGKQ